MMFPPIHIFFSLDIGITQFPCNHYTGDLKRAAAKRLNRFRFTAQSTTGFHFFPHFVLQYAW